VNRPAIAYPERTLPVRHRVRLGILAVALVVVAAGLLTFLVDLSGSPKTVSRITFENPTAYALDIEVSPGTDTGWTSAGSVRQQSTTDVQEVLDQGDVWLFRFDSQGESGGQLRMSRTELEAAGWRVVVPTDVGLRLAAAGAPPTP
jgi:hypothetical protein